MTRPRPQPVGTVTAKQARDALFSQSYGEADDGPMEAAAPDSPGDARAPGAAAAVAEDAGADAAGKVRKPRKKDPKLDLDLLKDKGGFDDLFHKFAPTFKATYRGPGNEVGDLGRLLDMFLRWQQRFYPYTDFDTFVTKLEKAGRSRQIKSEMHRMRQDLLGIVFPPPEPEELREPDQGAAAAAPARAAAAPAPTLAAAVAAAAATTAAAAAAAGADDLMELDDDELVALQREAEYDAAMEVLDEMEMAGPRHGGAGGPGAVGAEAARRELEEMTRLAEEEAAREAEEAAARAAAGEGAAAGEHMQAGWGSSGDQAAGGASQGGEAAGAEAMQEVDEREMDEQEEGMAQAEGGTQCEEAGAAAAAAGAGVGAGAGTQREQDEGGVEGEAEGDLEVEAEGGAAADAVLVDEDEELEALMAMDAEDAVRLADQQTQHAQHEGGAGAGTQGGEVLLPATVPLEGSCVGEGGEGEGGRVPATQAVESQWDEDAGEVARGFLLSAPQDD